MTTGPTLRLAHMLRNTAWREEARAALKERDAHVQRIEELERKLAQAQRGNLYRMTDLA